MLAHKYTKNRACNLVWVILFLALGCSRTSDIQNADKKEASEAIPENKVSAVHTHNNIYIRYSQPKITGAIDLKILKPALNKQHQVFSDCYASLYDQDKEKQGTIRVGFTITSNNTVKDFRFIRRMDQSEQFHACIKSSIESIHLSAPPNKDVSIVLPISFSSSSDAIFEDGSHSFLERFNDVSKTKTRKAAETVASVLNADENAAFSKIKNDEAAIHESIKDSMQSALVNACIIKMFKRIRFVKPQTEYVTFDYTLVFQRYSSYAPLNTGGRFSLKAFNASIRSSV